MATAKKPPRVLHIGHRFAPPAGAIVDWRGNKLVRRMQRLQAKRKASRIERSFTDAHLEAAEAQDVTNNGHAARRVLERESAHRRSR